MERDSLTIYIAGDSTAAHKSAQEKPMSGWGEFIGRYFDQSVNFENHAINGRSTKSFLDQNRLSPILDKAKPGDHLWIQFGHNDQKVEDPERYTDPFGDYKANLNKMILEARKRQMVIVLLTSISRRQFKAGKLNPASLGDYPKAMRQVAQKTNTPLVDMYKLSSDYLSKLGEEESKALFLHLNPGEFDHYPEGLTDNTHFSEAGAEIIAKMLADAITEKIPTLSLRKKTE